VRVQSGLPFLTLPTGRRRVIMAVALLERNQRDHGGSVQHVAISALVDRLVDGGLEGLLVHDEVGRRHARDLLRREFEVVRFGIGLTNAAYRTTPGSGDLRAADFEGAAARLEALAEELRPAWLAFVGKEAHRGTFRERPELGEQERRLAETRLFVLPSTSPANAAVPYAERLRWFSALRALAASAAGATGE
jgi:hypothetical protein